MTTPLLPDLAAFLDAVDTTEPEPLIDGYGTSPDYNFSVDHLGHVYLPGSSSLVMTDAQNTLTLWIQKALRTPRGVYDVYGPDYGTDLAANLGRHDSLDEALLNGPDDVRRCLFVHPLVADVPDVQLTRAFDADSLLVLMTIVDRFGAPTSLQVVV